MKTIVIGDIHGRDTWKDIVEREHDADNVIFIGDYFDSFNIPADKIQSNFMNIIKYKNSNPKKVTLLFGNHDFHYLDNDEFYSGYDKLAKFKNARLIKSAIELGQVQMAKIIGSFMFTHAGVSDTWYKTNIKVTGINKADLINILFTSNPEKFEFTPGINRSNTGDDVTQSPIWIRPESLMSDLLEGYTHVVGHTRGKNIRVEKDVIFIDCDLVEYLVIENDKVEIKRV